MPINSSFFRCSCVALFLAMALFSCQEEPQELPILLSPDGRIQVELHFDSAGTLQYKVLRDNQALVKKSPLGIEWQNSHRWKKAFPLFPFPIQRLIVFGRLFGANKPTSEKTIRKCLCACEKTKSPSGNSAFGFVPLQMALPFVTSLQRILATTAFSSPTKKQPIVSAGDHTAWWISCRFRILRKGLPGNAPYPKWGM